MKANKRKAVNYKNANKKLKLFEPKTFNQHDLNTRSMDPSPKDFTKMKTHRGVYTISNGLELSISPITNRKSDAVTQYSPVDNICKNTELVSLKCRGKKLGMMCLSRVYFMGIDVGKKCQNSMRKFSNEIESLNEVWNVK